MKSIELFIESHPVLFATIATLLPLLFPRVRAWVARAWRWMFSGRAVQRQIAEDVGFIKKEMQFNGGNSIRDIVVIQVNRQKGQFWRSARPSIEIGQFVQVQLVSESACHLFGVADPQQILSRNWLNFISGRVDEFLIAFENAMRFHSGINFHLPIRADDGTDRGTWEIRLSPITAQDSARPLYSGYFKPVCDTAKAIAADLQ